MAAGSRKARLAQWVRPDSGRGLVLAAALIVLILVAATPHPSSPLERLLAPLERGGSACGHLDVVSIPAKGRDSALCNTYELDAFRTAGDQAAFLNGRLNRPDEAMLARSGPLYVVRGPCWSALAADGSRARRIQSALGGTLWRVTSGASSPTRLGQSEAGASSTTPGCL